MRPFFFFIFAVLMLLAAPSMAVPIIGPVSDVGSNNATVILGGAVGTCWFEWGLSQGDNMSWRTPNQTPDAAATCEYTIKGSPIFGNQKWYFRGCDTTGCSADGNFTTLQVTPLPTFTYGAIFQNLTSNGFDITLIGLFTIAPYAWVVPTFPGLIWGLLLTGLLIGVWMRGRDLTYVSILGFILSVAFFGGSWGLGIDLDPTFIAAGQSIFYASIAGAVLTIIKK